MVAGVFPHALMLVGPPSAGKTTLALDIAAALLCAAPSPPDRPCRACRGCHLVEAGNHPDLHRVAPDGPGRQITIESVRRLLSELALLPAEGGSRVAVLEAAHRLTEDAQNAILKTLEEPPAGVAILLCADEEERLLPTIRSRCARLRLGPAPVREIEGLLGGLGLADAPAAARMARVAAGRPGLAVAYARAPEAMTIRGEISRTLLDLLAERPARRLAIVRDLMTRAGGLAAALDSPGAVGPASAGRGRRGARATAGVAEASPAQDTAAAMPNADDPALAVEPVGDSGVKAAPSERRRAALMLLDIWRDLGRDLALAVRSNRTSLRDPGLLDELEGVAPGVESDDVGAFLTRLARTVVAVDANANPELALDVLVLRWPHATSA